jgi:uncharacterized membrane protein YdjX (TVP38/TMEM64 family)
MSSTPEPGPPATDAPPSPKPSRSWGRWLVAATFILLIGAYFALGLHHKYDFNYFREHVDYFHAQVEEHLVLALLVFFVIYVAATALSLPIAAVLSLLAGALFGRWLGTALVDVAATLGATLAFLSSRYLFQEAIQRRFGQKLDALNRGVEKDGGFYLFTLRLVPLFPFFLINLGMGLTRIRVWTYVWVSLLGMLPGTFVYVNAGTALSTIASPKDVFSREVVISLALLGIAPLLFRKGMQLFRGR